MSGYGHLPCYCGAASTWDDDSDVEKEFPRRCSLCLEPCLQCRCRVFGDVDELVAHLTAPEAPIAEA